MSYDREANEKLVASMQLKQLEAENARLREELAAKDSTIASCDELLALSRTERDSLREQLTAAQADAARYRNHCRNRQVAAWMGLDPNAENALEQLDAAIDNAMKEQS